MNNHSVAEVREAAKLLAMVRTMHIPEAYLNDNCFPRAP